ncbi:hypothetical protein LTR28_008860 [Elasticomyces elasticus]|nr:hypothetical protein LTR28_008860 [Elasticomyces elasticus]
MQLSLAGVAVGAGKLKTEVLEEATDVLVDAMLVDVEVATGDGGVTDVEDVVGELEDVELVVGELDDVDLVVDDVEELKTEVVEGATLDDEIGVDDEAVTVVVDGTTDEVDVDDGEVLTVVVDGTTDEVDVDDGEAVTVLVEGATLDDEVGVEDEAVTVVVDGTTDEVDVDGGEVVTVVVVGTTDEVEVDDGEAVTVVVDGGLNVNGPVKVEVDITVIVTVWVDVGDAPELVDVELVDVELAAVDATDVLDLDDVDELELGVRVEVDGVTVTTLVEVLAGTLLTVVVDVEVFVDSTLEVFDLVVLVLVDSDPSSEPFLVEVLSSEPLLELLDGVGVTVTVRIDVDREVVGLVVVLPLTV